MRLFLAPEEVEELTGRRRPSAQARMLDRMGISYIDHPEGPRVLRKNVDTADHSEAPSDEPDFSAIRKAS